MLRLPDFHFVRPRSLSEAVKELADRGPEAMAVGGGTDLYPKMKRGQLTPCCVVSLKALPELKGIELDGHGGLRIGAGETLIAVSRNSAVKEFFPALASAAASVANPQIRNAGTIGGNVLVDTRCNYYDQTFFWRKAAGFCLKKDGTICLVASGSDKCLAIFSSDTAPVLCSLGAIARLVGPDGARELPFRELYRDDGINFVAKRSDEVLRDILIPHSAFGCRNTYIKLRRRDSFDFPILGVAAAIRFGNDSTCVSASVVLTGVASAPKLVERAGALLVGKKVTPEVIEAVAQAAVAVSHPLDNADLTNWYRKRMTKVYTEKALAALAAS